MRGLAGVLRDPDGHDIVTLRDWFAAHASDDDIFEHRHYWSEDGDVTVYVTRTREEAKFAHADAMLAAREAKS